MIAEMQSSLRALSDWMRGVEGLAQRRHVLLNRVEEILLGQIVVSDTERLELADRLERLRYHVLDQRRWRPDAMSRRLADVLDMAVVRLTGRKARLPRCPHDAIGDCFTQPEALVRGMQCLDPEVPLETAAHRAARMTLDSFSAPAPDDAIVLQRRMSLYAPLPITNFCINYCRYCGCRRPRNVERSTMTVSQAIQMGESCLRHAVRRVLLVAGDYPRLLRGEFLKEVTAELSVRGLEVWLEVAPLSTSGYESLVQAGVSRVVVHQETYDDILYAHYHQRGIKRWYDWRLEALDRAAEAGCPSLGLGILLGLNDPMADFPALVRHALYLKSRHPECNLAFSLPRLLDTPEDFEVPCPVDDAMFTRVCCALRVAMPDAELMVSPRESPRLRNRLAQICATQLGVCVCEMPGNFEFSASPNADAATARPGDSRTPTELVDWLHANSFQVSP